MPPVFKTLVLILLTVFGLLNMGGKNLATILFGGSFNPVHLGHLAMARVALKRFPSATLLWMPAACSPFKTNQTLASEHHRLAMCQLVSQDDPRMKVSDLEFTLDKPSYTVHTVKKLKELQPDQYYFLCGADAFLSLFRWKNIEELVTLVTFLVANREEVPGEILEQQKNSLEKLGGKVIFLDMEPCPVSSTDIRDSLKNHPSSHKFIHPKVLRYIQENRLYGE